MLAKAREFGAIITVVLTLATSASGGMAESMLPKAEIRCFAAIAKDGGKFLATRLKILDKCATKNLSQQGACDQLKRDQKLAQAELKLKRKLDKRCGALSKLVDPDLALNAMGFPGKCPDGTGPPFTDDDLEACIAATHARAADTMFEIQFGANGNIDDPSAVEDFLSQTGDSGSAKVLKSCQKEISKNMLKFVGVVLKETQKCRNGILKGKLGGFEPEACGDNPVYTKAKDKIDRVQSKIIAKIEGKCDDPVPSMLDVCGGGGAPATTVAALTSCLIDSHRDIVDDPDQSALADVLDIEYGGEAFCGDGVTNDRLAVAVTDPAGFSFGSPPEECDGDDDAACPGLCGATDGDFPCLCLSTPRMKVAEGATINSDNGWNGITHDTALLAGAGHIVDLFDCDGPGGPDTLCTVGPSCALPPHGPCANDGDCAGGGDFCRKGPTAIGPHCHEDVQQECDSTLDCPGPTDFCRKTLTSPPIPVSAGGVSACTLNVITEDIVGTVDVATGDSAVRLRQSAMSFLGLQDRPCPLCGGFCDTEDEPSRTPCSDDSDCTGAITCQLASLCSVGPNAGRPCRTAPPAGGTSPIFGTTSIDCPIGGAPLGKLDIITDPRRTGPVTLLPSFTCTAPGFEGDQCIAGSETGRACEVDSDCPGGGSGSCRGQCFCPADGGQPTAPNACLAACRGGANDYLTCTGDTDCPGGFCQEASCRLALDVCITGATLGASCAADSDCSGGLCGDDDSTQEGFCPAGPLDGRCNLTTIKQCTINLECRPASQGGSCSFCEESEECLFTNRDCFVNEGISRAGFPGVPNRARAAAFCIPNSGQPLIDAGGGFPGPGATEGPETVSFTGLN